MENRPLNGKRPEPPRETPGNAKGPLAGKPFWIVGPTLHYSHQNVRICWLLGVAVFVLACLLWSKITTGSFWSIEHVGAVFIGRGWHLHRFVLSGISVFEYPWQILVLGILMGIFGVAPLLTAQLLSFRFCLPFIFALIFIANLPGMGFTLVICCIGVVCRPLRFRSRIISIALCMSPLLAYWGYFGGAHGQDPIEWGFSFAPWVAAWLVGLVLAGVVLGIGHFTRYRPGLVWSSTIVMLLLALAVFEWKIGFDELAFQLYVSENSPEEAPEFHGHGITEVLDETITNPRKRQFLSEFFYPPDPIPLREELKQEMQVRLSYDRWPSWVDEDLLPEQLRYQEKREWLLGQYDLFIDPPRAWWLPSFLHEQLHKRRSASKRMAIALYYRASLLEYAPDPCALGRDEILTFYNDHPFERARETWHHLRGEFSASPEALEAHWRIAKHVAGLGQFERAEKLLIEARERLVILLSEEEQSPAVSASIFKQFRPPAESVMTRTKLLDLLSRIDRLANLIGPENRDQTPQANSSLAMFVMLNPYALDYPKKLRALQHQLSETDRLHDNIQLALAKLIADQQRREERLRKIHEDNMGSDGGREALFELGLLKIRRYQEESDPGQKNKSLTDARATLASYLELYQDSIFSARVAQNLAGLPDAE